MAMSRRPPIASSSSRPRFGGGPQSSIPPSRSRSVLGKSAASSKSAEDVPLPPPGGVAAALEQLLSPSKRGGMKEETGDNIQVVVRCRGRSEREISENSPIIIACPMSKTPSPQPQEVTVETSPLQPSLAPLPGSLVGGPPTRTYPFDRVFGPEVDQATIYEDVVGPLLREVLEGYNCTLFAYGQTGTGKTYTMQGDLTPSPLTGGPSTNAGMIPRALSSLFRILSETTTDYSVKVSYIELYNEELRDLLAPELSAPIGSAQPMGRPREADSAAGGLKLFDDKQKRGILIQGLEEVAIKDERDAMKLLLKGSQRRQIAATKFNDHSSRSHSVFTITVHSTTPAAATKLGVPATSGDNDLLKIGKLNLVDLAGSENIGRSGAEDKRAREAGKINQSLLVLGRVINALVDQDAHVPYRESKLTRLLQDSLGGRTKTTIIATVSPARSNIEETLSTLEYAIRAKTIKNRPELNQRMSRGALIREYCNEIERLKADLFAAREKDGVYVSNETWKELTEESEFKRTAHVEAARRVMELETQLKNVREEFEQSLALLMKRDNELRDAKQRIAKDAEDLRIKQDELTGVRKDLEEEVVVRQAFEDGEKHVDGVAVELKGVLKEGLSDVDGLFDKIERKSAAFGRNKDVVLQHAAKLQQETVKLDGAVDSYGRTLGETVKAVRAQVENLNARQNRAMAQQSKYIDDRLNALVKSIDFIRTQEEHTDAAAAAMATTVRVDGDVVREEVKSWASTLRTEVDQKVQEMKGVQEGAFKEVGEALDGAFELVKGIVKQAGEYVEREKKAFEEMQGAIGEASKAEIHRLQQQNAQLARILAGKRGESKKRLDDLVAQTISQITSLAASYSEGEDRDLEELLAYANAESGKAQEMVREDREMVGGLVERRVEDAGRMGETAEGWVRLGDEKRENVFETVGSALESSKHGANRISESVSGMVATHMDNVDKRFTAMNSSFMEAYGRVESSKRSRIQATDTLDSDVQESYRALKRRAVESTQEMQEASAGIASEASSLHESHQSFRASHSSRISVIRQCNKAIVDEGTKEDEPTNLTPQRRNWRYPDQWTLTASREEVLADWHRRQEAIPEDDVVPPEAPEVVMEPEEPLPVQEAVRKPSLLSVLPSPLSDITDENRRISPVFPLAVAAVKTSKGVPRAASRVRGTENTNIVNNPMRASKRVR